MKSQRTPEQTEAIAKQEIDGLKQLLITAIVSLITALAGHFMGVVLSDFL